MPYSYYQFVRLSAFVGFAYLGYETSQREESPLAIAFFGLALLFQPFFKIALGREIWNIVDVAVGVGLLLTILNTKTNT
jgi:hypothetical protein